MDEIFCLSNDWKEIVDSAELIPFGMGRIGRRVISSLMNEFDIPFLIDNREKQDIILGLKVLTLENARDYLKTHNCKIVVTTVYGAYQEIKKQLEGMGFVENVDFCVFERFVVEWNLRWKNKCVLSKIDTVITSRCTLRCKNCNMFISCMEQHNDLPLEELQNNFDVFFGSVDYVYEYTLLGGEPFLHKKLKDILVYMCQKYGDKIGKINLISNGTVIPSDEVIHVMKKYKIMVNISDYTNAVPYKERLKEVEGILKNNGIECYIIPNNVWKNVCYPRCEYFTDNPREHMKLCGHGTHSVDGGRLYWCDPAFASERFLNFCSREDDSLELLSNKLNCSKYDASLNIIKYILGNVNERGYMTICEKCAGVGSDNNKVVVAGEQCNDK